MNTSTSDRPLAAADSGGLLFDLSPAEAVAADERHTPRCGAPSATK